MSNINHVVKWFILPYFFKITNLTPATHSISFFHSTKPGVIPAIAKKHHSPLYPVYFIIYKNLGPKNLKEGFIGNIRNM